MMWTHQQKVQQAVRVIVWKFPFHTWGRENQIWGLHVFGALVSNFYRIVERYNNTMLNPLKNNILLAVGFAILTVIDVQAQNGSGYFNQAENLFKSKNYYEASVVFEKYLATEKHSRPRSTPFAIEKKVKGKTNLDPHQEAVYQLATCYRMVNDYQKAEKYYKESIKFS